MKNEYQMAKLGEIAEVTKLAGFEFTKHIKYIDDGEIIALRALNLRDGELDLTDVKRISRDVSDSLTRSKLYKNEILLTYTGNGYGDCAIIDEDDKYHLAPNICKITPNEQMIDPYYLYIVIRDSGFRRQMRNYVGGSSQPTIPMKTIRLLEVPLPPIEIQKKISEVVLSIDEKIRVNTQICDLLERQGAERFSYLFQNYAPYGEGRVDSPTGLPIPDSLCLKQIRDIPHILETGKRPKGGASETGIPSVGAENVKKLGKFNYSSNKYIPSEFADTLDKGRVNGYELMIYKDGGKPGEFKPHFSMFGEGFPYEYFFINEHVFKLDFGDRGYNEFAYYYFQTPYVLNWLMNNGGKAAIPGINRGNIEDIWIIDPRDENVMSFCKWIQPLFTSILTKCRENKELLEMRNTTVPRLLAGAIEICC